MNKYKEAYDVVLRQEYYFKQKGYSVGEVVEAENIIHELIDKETELLSRKDKLVVGSEWECVVRCHSSNTFHCVGELVKIGEIEDTFVWLEDSVLDTYVNDSQFLLCFKPKEK